MTKEEVTRARELLGDNNIYLFLDNALEIFSWSECTDVIWDDALEVCYVFLSNNSRYGQAKKPFELKIFPYDVIQYMTGYYDENAFKAVLTTMKTKGIIDDARIAEILAEFDSLIKNKPNVMGNNDPDTFKYLKDSNGNIVKDADGNPKPNPYPY